jgi:hypothetical protein
MEETGAWRQVTIPVKPVRYVLVHYHIFKNAGTSIEFALSQAFGDRFCAIHGPEADSVLSGTDLARFVEAHPEFQAVSSHHLKFPVPEMRGTVLIDCCFLREPLDRIWSMYKYFKRIETTDELSERAKHVDAKSFAELLVRDYPHMINDVQVNLLANGGVYLRPPDETDFVRAVNILDRTSLLGVVDFFDESMTAAEYYLRPVFPVKLDYIRQNASDSNGDVRQLAGSKLYAQLAALNQLDLKLVERARGEVLRRFRMIPASADRLADFRRRCEERRRRQLNQTFAAKMTTCPPGSNTPISRMP